MKFWQALSFTEIDQLVDVARICEEVGFHGVFVSDHVVYPEVLDTPYPYTEDGSRRYDETSDFPDPWVVAGALSSVTTRLRFTTNVFVLPMRNPFLAAKAVATAAAMSSNRVTLTIGVGWSNVEFELVGQAFRRRGARADEMLEVMRKLWSGEMVDHEGEFYRFDRLKLTPPIPTRPIPIWVGGISDFALRRAARNDGWLSDLQTTDEIIECIDKVRSYRKALGKSETFDVMASASDANDIDGYRRLGDGGVNHILTMPWAFYHGLTEDLEKKIDGTKRFADDVIAKMS